jgi:hypothetical protein
MAYNEIDNKEAILATKAYDTLELELQDGTEVLIRPLDLKRLRKVMVVIDDMNKSGAKTEADTLEYLIAATKISLEKQLPELTADEDKFEEALDLPTIWKILEITAGISMTGNQMGEAALPGLI